MKIIRNKDKKNESKKEDENRKPEREEENKDKHKELTKSASLDKSLEKNIAAFRQYVGSSQDIVIRKIKLPISNGIDSALIYIEELADKDTINNVIKALKYITLLNDTQKALKQKTLLNKISEEIITNTEVEQLESWTEIIDKLMSGDTFLIVNGIKCAVIIGTRKWTDRGVQQSENEQVIRGPRDSFNETLSTNIMLLRRRIKSQKLRFETMVIGSLTKTDITIVYIEGIVNNKLVEEVRKRLGRIETDMVLESNMIEEFIEDNSYSPIPQITYTERPDVVSSKLVEGRVAILVDGVPNALVVPATFWEFLYSVEDYYQRVYTSMVVRLLRIISLFVALGLPAFYVAITTFHHEQIPVALLDIIISGRHNIPFPMAIEVFVMEFILEVIREAGVRLPRNVGQAISIVGALVLGQAAIQARIASPATVTVVAIAAIANFTIPVFNAALSIRVTRFFLLIVSSILGIFGFLTAFFIFLIHLCSLRSFGSPYMAPFAPLIPADLKDSLIRTPIWAMSFRPKSIGAKDRVRQKKGMKPGPE